MTKQDYILKYKDTAQVAGSLYGINPTIILAQSAHESGWGSSTNVAQANNFFGVTASGKPNQYWSGKSRTASTGLKFRVYATPTDSFKDFARLIKEKYPTSAKVSSNVKLYAHSIAQSPYISEENGDDRTVYEKAIISIANEVNKILGEQWFKKAVETTLISAFIIGISIGIIQQLRA